MHIQHPGGDALGFQLLRRLDGQAHGIAVGDDGNVLAVPDLVGLADDELGVLIVDHGDLVAGEAQVHRTVLLRSGAYQLAGGPVVRGHDDGHVGDGAVDAHILDGLVAGTVVGRCHTAVGAGDLYVQVGVACFLTDHLAHAHGAEGGVGHHEGDLAAGSQTCCHAGAVLLGDAHVEVLLRQFLAEGAGLAGLADVGVHHEDVLIFFSQFHDLVAETVSGGDHFIKSHFTVLLSIPRTGRPVRPLPVCTAHRWVPHRASQPGSP